MVARQRIYINKGLHMSTLHSKLSLQYLFLLLFHNLSLLKNCLFSMENSGNSKILIIGATGYMGKFIVEASAKAGHPTFALVRESTLSDPSKSPIIQTFKTLGVNLLLVR